MIPPDDDEVEVTVFGPGYGESIVIHLGSNQWTVVDSCLNDDRRPAPLAYFEDIEVEPSEAVVAVVASHWHDDHIKGLADVLSACSNSRFSLSSALQKEEFLGVLEAFEDQPVRKLDRGGTEVLRCLRVARDKELKVRPLGEETIIHEVEAGVLGHGDRVELRALSPSGKQFLQFLARMEGYVEATRGKAKKRLSEPGRNDLSSAMLLTVGDRSVLLGADLEDNPDRQLGWRAVVDNHKDRSLASKAFKVPHHGSPNAHNDEVWDQLLDGETYSVVTPWRLGGRQLPSEEDKVRISDRSAEAFITSTETRSLKKKYSAQVMKLIRQSGTELKSVTMRDGSVTMRWKPGEAEPSVSLARGASKLSVLRD